MAENTIKSIIQSILGEQIDDSLLSDYISQAQDICADWEYSLIGVPADLDKTKYNTLVIDAVVTGYSIRGAENETQHSENGILRGFSYTDMRDYIRAHLTPYARLR